MYVYSNNGLAMRAVDTNYVAQTGEVLFPQMATPDQLTAAFPDYASAAAILARQPFIATAQAALDKSDTTVVRCVSATVAVPSAWQTYRAALRAIVNGSDTVSTTLPSMPPYPTGT